METMLFSQLLFIEISNIFFRFFLIFQGKESEIERLHLQLTEAQVQLEAGGGH